LPVIAAFHATPAGFAHAEYAVPVSVFGDAAQVDLSGLNAPVSGIRLGYYPQFEVFALRPTQSADANGNVFGWELICEEV
jgi:hypothetical protein